MPANALVSVRFMLNITEDQINSIVGREDDDSDEYVDYAHNAIEDYMKEEFYNYLDQMTNGEPDIEVDF